MQDRDWIATEHVNAEDPALAAAAGAMADIRSLPKSIPSLSTSDILGVIVGLLLSAFVLTGAISTVVNSQTNLSHRTVVEHAIILFVFAAMLLGGTAFLCWDARATLRYRRLVLSEFRASLLSVRARRAGQALQEATVLVEELKTELDARTALLEDIRRQVEKTNRRAEDMEQLARVDDETTRILNRYFDEALKSRLGDLEHGAKRREWLLGTIGALLFGIIAILLSHYLFGF
jgi:signal transduction histidine kinase